MSYWLINWAMPIIAVSFLVLGGGLYLVFLAIGFSVSAYAPATPHLRTRIFGYVWMASVGAVAGILAPEFGYQLNFWDAPGIWGHPGKSSTGWALLQVVLPPCGLALGVMLNAALERRAGAGARAVRVALTGFASLLLIATVILSAKHAFETMG